ncbi:uncharacterized protein LOC108631830 [Ceratina calcarata]|uniref:Uncharacterized protein LOC108631830 n=1 Tax=Ceratina calcarata TaxID=156304 RepID=A0AAJ7SCK2_9HYME|nr:uncharacterized protein LOC108631830 [Ceratina calcarata]
MSLKHRKDISFSVTVYFLKVVGFWMSSTRGEELFRNAMMASTLIGHIVLAWIQYRNLYFLWGDISLFGSTLCSLTGLLLDLFKLSVLYVHKEKFFSLIVYMRKNFWHLEYDKYENLILMNARQISVYFVCVFSFFSQSTTFSYMISPLMSNIGKNESERALIFNMWLDLPLSMSPYYEIVYVIQSLILYQLGVSYLSIDNMFCIFCLHVASQFRILQYRVSEMPGLKMTQDGDPTAITSRRCYIALKCCIQQHQALIQFCSTLEEIFGIIILGQVIVFSALISFLGYQVILVDMDPAWRMSFVSYLLTTLCQLWIFTYSCDCVTRESSNVATAIYAAPWIHLSMDEFGRTVRKDLLFMMMRTSQPCSLTAGGFLPISLETYTKIMSTAMSYFTIMKQRTVDVEDTSRRSYKFRIYRSICSKFSMNLKHRGKLYFSVAIFFLQSAGYWSTTTRVEEWIKNVMILFSTLSLTFLMFVQTRCLYFYWGDLAMITYIVVNILVLVIDAFKMIILFVHKKKFFKLIAHMKEHFWHENYNQQESVIVEDTERLCKYFVYIFTFFCQSTVFCYCLRTIVGNIGRNESERELIFNMWLDLPLSMTPYFEITFTIQAVALYQIGMLYFCFDNVFCIMCLHVAGQFRVLQYRMSNMPMVKGMKNLNGNSTAELSKQCHVSLINYIEEHKALIEFCATLEGIFRIIILGQVSLFSLLICILGYQIALVDLPLIWNFTFAMFLSAGMIQLWMFTYSCDCVTQESLNVAAAVYAGPWIHLSMDKFGAMIRKNLEFVIMRSGRPSSLTALGFFPISLQTYTKIMSTAMSYFTLLKQSSVDTTKT